jgi:hypothetical protein
VAVAKLNCYAEILVFHPFLGVLNFIILPASFPLGCLKPP